MPKARKLQISLDATPQNYQDRHVKIAGDVTLIGSSDSLGAGIGEFYVNIESALIGSGEIRLGSLTGTTSGVNLDISRYKATGRVNGYKRDSIATLLRGKR